MLHLELPYPPSINHYFRVWRGRTVISRAGRQFRVKVWWICRQRQIRPMHGPLKVLIDAWPPDHRRRDVDNLLKPTLDALQHGGAFIDDCQVVWLLTRKRTVIKDGRLRVQIKAGKEETCERRRKARSAAALAAEGTREASTAASAELASPSRCAAERA